MSTQLDIPLFFLDFEEKFVCEDEMSSRSVQLNSTTVLLFIPTYSFFVFVLFLGSGMRNSFQMRCLSSVPIALFPTALICQNTVCGSNTELVWA